MPRYVIFEHTKSVTTDVYIVEAASEEEAKDILIENNIDPIETFTEKKADYLSDMWTEVGLAEKFGR